MTVITFSTKTEVFSFLNDIKNYGISGNIVPTPKQLKIGCGLAVSVNDNYFNLAYSMVKYRGYPTFRGIYKITYKNGVKSLVKLV